MQPKNFSIGIDIGGTNTAFGIVDRRGNILFQEILSTRDYDNARLLLVAIRQRMEIAIDKYGPSNISGIGIGAPTANYYTGTIAISVNLNWGDNVPLRRLAEEVFDLPATVTNDANATAIGEMTYGTAKGMKDFIIVTLGTGVGSGIVANGQLIYGHDGFAGELGHMIAVREGRLCACGRKGCLERYASATGIVLSAYELLEGRSHLNPHESATHPDWLEPIYKREGKITSRIIHQAALAGDPLALELFDYTGRILGQCLADAVVITSPQAIILFGGLAKSGDFILQPTQKHMEANLLSLYKNKIAIIPSGLIERDAAILGASALGWQG